MSGTNVNPAQPGNTGGPIDRRGVPDIGDIGEPGQHVIEWKGESVVVGGTGAAAALAAGFAAIYRAHNPNATPSQMRDALVAQFGLHGQQS